MQLNLTTGRNLPDLFKRGTLPKWVHDSKKWNRYDRLLSQHIADRYHTVYGDCFIPEEVRIYYESNGNYEWRFTPTPDIPWTKLEGMPPVEERMFDCVQRSSAVKLVAIIVGIKHPKWNGDLHGQLLIINKVRRAIELYDSNGWNFIEDDMPGHLNVLWDILRHIFKYPDVIRGSAKSWPLEGFTFVPFSESNLKNGLQVYEARETEACYDVGGFCGWWALYYAELRAQQINDSAPVFKVKMARRLRQLINAGYNLGKYFRDVMLDYLVQAGNQAGNV